VTNAGRAFLKKPTSFKIVEDNDFSDSDEEVVAKGGVSCAIDPELTAILKDLRKKIAKQHNLPPYVIFQDQSIDAMATTYPISIEELEKVPGVGPGKAKRYGDEFIKVIKRYVEENDIERPEDLMIRGLPKKADLKQPIINGIDRRIPLDELAESNGLEFNELLDVIEAMVHAGMKINIDYFISEIMDEDSENEIFEYFKESESGDVDTAVEELGNDFTEDEIRLVRIKFLSELGN